METVSNRWKDLHKTDLLPEQHIEITYKVTETGVNDSYTAEDNGHVPWSSLDSLDNADNIPKYATLEENIWTLDGSLTIPPDNAPYGDGKYVGDVLCGEDGVFTVIPAIVLKWPESNEGLIPGLTIQWSETYQEYPISYRVKVYSGDTLIHQLVNEENDSAFNVFLIDIQNYDRIAIEILKWNLPYRRARMEKVFVGIVNTYTKGDLMNYSHEDSVDILSGELPKDSITFSLDNVESQWNPLNTEGVSKYLMERQTLHVRYGMDIDGMTEWIDGGVFFLSEWNTPSNGLEASFTARDMLEFMNIPYTGVRSGSLYDIAIAAITQAELPDDATYRFDASLLTIDVDFNEDTSDYTVSEILQMTANAARCILYQDRKGCLRIEPVGDVLSDYVISQYISYSHPEFTLSKELKSVDVNNGMAVIENGSKGEVQTVDNPLVTTASHAADVGTWIKDTLKGRKTVSGEFRADTRLSAGDLVTVENKFSEAGNRVFVTNIKYDFGGAFKGSFEGRVMD